MTLLKAITPRPIQKWIDRLAILKFRDNPDFDPKKNHLFFRCISCRRVMTAKDTVTRLCVCRETNRIRPAVLTSREQLWLLWRLIFA